LWEKPEDFDVIDRENATFNCPKNALCYFRDKSSHFNGKERDTFRKQISGNADIIVVQDCVDFPIPENRKEINLWYKKNFIPKSQIGKTINSFSSHHKMKEMVGFHIRRTDHKLAMETPISSFINFASKIPGKNIFICSDDKKAIEVFKEKLPYKNIYFYPHFSRKRGDKQGMESAVIDLWLLSKTKYIVGNSTSFSYEAGLIGNVPVKNL
jgi:hypothetical protein